MNEHEHFELVGHDIHTSVNISVLQALNGFNHSLPYLHGLVVNFTRTGITSPGTPIVVPGMGLPKPPRGQQEGGEKTAQQQQQTPESPTTTHHNISQYANPNAGDLVITIRVPMPSELRRKVYSMTLGSDDGWAEAEEDIESVTEGVSPDTDTDTVAHADAPPNTACAAENGLCAEGARPADEDSGTHRAEEAPAIGSTETERDSDEVINLDDDEDSDDQ